MSDSVTRVYPAPPSARRRRAIVLILAVLALAAGITGLWVSQAASHSGEVDRSKLTEADFLPWPDGVVPKEVRWMEGRCQWCIVEHSMKPQDSDPPICAQCGVEVPSRLVKFCSKCAAEKNICVACGKVLTEGDTVGRLELQGAPRRQKGK